MTRSEHQPIIYGPVVEGERTISGGTYPMSGYGWSCSCGQSGFGYVSEGEADDYAERHSADWQNRCDCLGGPYPPGDPMHRKSCEVVG